MKSKNFFTGERIYLRAPELKDLDLIYKVENVADQWAENTITTPYSSYTIHKYITENSHDIFIDRQLRLMIIDQVTNQILGMIDLIDYVPLHRRASVGVIILPEYRKRGFALESLELLKQYSFDFLQMHQLFAYVASDNLASLSLFKKAGFQQTSVLKDWLFIGNEVKDVFLWQMINS